MRLVSHLLLLPVESEFILYGYRPVTIALFLRGYIRIISKYPKGSRHNYDEMAQSLDTRPLNARTLPRIRIYILENGAQLSTLYTSTTRVDPQSKHIHSFLYTPPLASSLQCKIITT